MLLNSRGPILLKIDTTPARLVQCMAQGHVPACGLFASTVWRAWTRARTLRPGDGLNSGRGRGLIAGNRRYCARECRGRQPPVDQVVSGPGDARDRSLECLLCPRNPRRVLDDRGLGGSAGFGEPARHGTAARSLLFGLPATRVERERCRCPVDHRSPTGAARLGRPSGPQGSGRSRGAGPGWGTPAMNERAARRRTPPRRATPTAPAARTAASAVCRCALCGS